MARSGEFDWTTGGDVAPPSDLSVAVVDAFASSMPARYRVLFDLRTIRKHAAICHRRGVLPAYAEVWRTLADGSAALCIVADDRPGLLSAIAASLVSHHLDVITALVFSRIAPGGREAVDLVWVRRANTEDVSSIDDDEAASVGQVLSAILSGNISVEEIAAHTPLAPASGDHRIVVRFDDVDEEGLAPLFIEAPDRPGILLAITLEVFQQGAQIVRSLVRTSGGRVFNQFELAEFSGAPLSAERCEHIRAAVFAAMSLREAREGKEVPRTDARSR
jgi:[protein-PII] uridylyltransferase